MSEKHEDLMAIFHSYYQDLHYNPEPTTPEQLQDAVKMLEERHRPKTQEESRAYIGQVLAKARSDWEAKDPKNKAP